MEQPKISIIVPIYNVEPYLETSLRSIAGQTFRELEVILVDDGSSDGCGRICDTWAAKDSRFRVIHQANGGVSAARNAGLDAATGEWIGWVDPDDWIDNDMFDHLLSGAAEADICICGRYEEFPRRRAMFGPQKRQILNREDALQALLEERYMDNALYDKLWRRALFEGIRFPVGQTYEDLAVVWRLFERAQRVCCLPGAKYHYRRRAASITGDTSLPNRMNHCIAARQRFQDMTPRWPRFHGLLEARCVTAMIGIWCGWYHNPRGVRNAWLPQIRELAAYAKPRCPGIGKGAGLGLAGRLVVRLLPYPQPWAFALAWLIGNLYRLRHGRSL